MSSFLTVLSLCFPITRCRLELTNMKLKQLMHTLVDLDKKAEAIDKLVVEIRLEINDLFWNLAKSKKNNDTVNVLKRNFRLSYE